jgi:ornithine carbamoyltransferase
MRHFLKTADLSAEQLRALLDLSHQLVADPLLHRGLLANESVVLHFAEPSTRTRLSMETAVARLGGLPISVGPDDLQLGRGETIEDTARVVSTYAKAFVIRSDSDDDVQTFAKAARIPVVNALTPTHHPCQSLADLLTLEQCLGDLTQVRVAWVGDGNNVCHSLMEALALAGATLHVATPESLAPDDEVVRRAQRLADEHGATLVVGTDPQAAVDGVHAVYTDTWNSMDTPDEERKEREELLTPYRVTEELMQGAHDDAIFLHCLPGHRGEEMTAEVIDGPRSKVVQQAGNRLPTAAAVLATLVSDALEAS